MNQPSTWSPLFARPRGIGGILAGLLAGLWGCGESDPEGSFGLTWALEYADGGTTSCSAMGAVRVVVTARPESGEDVGSVLPCSSGGGVTRGLPPGPYTIDVRLEDEQGRALSVLALPEPFVLGPQGVVHLGHVLFEVLAFRLRWSIEAHQGDTLVPVTCAAAGAASVELSSLLLTTGEWNVYVFPCEAYAGRTEGIVAGQYEVRVQLIGFDGSVLSGLLPRRIDTAASGADLGIAVFDLPVRR